MLEILTKSTKKLKKTMQDYDRIFDMIEMRMPQLE